MTEKQMETIGNIYFLKMSEVNETYLNKIGKHLKDIGSLKASDIRVFEQMQRVTKNVAEFERELEKAMNLSISELNEIYAESTKKEYGKAKSLKDDIVPFAENEALKRVIIAQAETTKQTLLNLANTTIMRQDYQNAVDSSIRAVMSGVTDYNSAIRSTVQNLGGSGIRVQYGSGAKRRLDSAVKMNVISGVRDLQMNINKQIGKDVGADGVELSAHMNCAEDHQPYQGKQYTNEEFETLQNTLKRPIGTLNCKHIARPVIIGISEPTYSNTELREYKKYSNEKITIGEDTKTRYEWSQFMRSQETTIRYAKETKIIAKSSGDNILYNRENNKIKLIRNKYDKVVKETGLTPRLDNMRVYM